ncbi:ABC transporter ATP-binding protein [Planosporangium thailandense]|uniref:ABC transporter ATP-binding protein n=1 Tax=Planosporangium thailandense TaxID=765197 RepID=A0ABX0Y7I1_9ACTN|nr:ABC transporter ATP-binding protein [Planosporangium thailandense]NJC74077.1 ABC transporter ATP-binding protein [Planosporangium thailandense]
MSVNVTFDNLTVDLGGTRILDGVDLEIPAGSFVTLLGPSGSGKTTTLNVLAGFIERSGGHVRVDDKAIDDLPAHARNIGFLFQNYALFPHMNVGENVAFPLRARKIPAARRREMVADALRLVQLPDMQSRAIRSLSGGQQQRIALARALVFKPALLLLDEPLAALDKQLREAMQLELKRIQLETGTTTIAVTHDQIEAMSMADLVAIMNKGRLVQVGSPEEVYRRPADLFVATFLGEANLLPVSGGRVTGFRHAAATSRAEGIGVLRPEDIQIRPAAADDTAPGKVELSVFQGNRRRVTVRCAGIDTPVVISAPPSGVAAEVGDEVHLAIGVDRVHVVPAS